MKHLWMIPLVAVLTVSAPVQATANAGPPPCTPATAPKEAVAASAQAWLDSLGAKGFQTRIGPLAATYSNRPNTAVSATISVQNGDFLVTLGFKAPVSPGMTAATLTENLSFVAHDGISIPALATPHWQITARPPSSHLTDGLEIKSAGAGQLHLRLTHARLFAVHGQDLRAEGLRWADAPMPPSCFFQIRRDFRAVIDLDLRVTGWRN